MIGGDARTAAAEPCDLLIVGGGAYGAMLLLEAARRDLRAVLLERDDFGGATSWNSLRVVHGGLRYLQTADLPRFRQSVRARSWFLSTFPEAVRPLACLMPLYAEGMRRPALLAAALVTNDLLSAAWNRGLPEGSRLPPGRLVGRGETATRFPAVDQRGLRAGALWYDAVMAPPQRVLMETLRWACAAGAAALNYVEARRVEIVRGRVTAVEAVDRRTGDALLFRATAVVNCAGPWCRAFARTFDRDEPSLFRPSLAFNLLLRRGAVSDCAVAVAPRRPGGRVYFLVPYRDKVVAGTYHAPWAGGSADPVGPTEPQVRAMLDDLNSAVPDWALTSGDVLRVFAGLLPARRDADTALAVRPRIHVHADAGGPAGAVSVSGVKFTTSHMVAEEVCHLLQRRGYARPGPARTPPRPGPRPNPDLPALVRMAGERPDDARSLVRALVEEEGSGCLDDLLLRRTDWGTDPTEEPTAGGVVRQILGGDTWAKPGPHLAASTQP